MQMKNERKGKMKEMSKKRSYLKNKKEKGITLIALVITIIVLLVLAGVTIAMLMGDNGILTKATESQVETRGRSSTGSKRPMESGNKC